MSVRFGIPWFSGTGAQVPKPIQQKNIVHLFSSCSACQPKYVLTTDRTMRPDKSRGLPFWHEDSTKIHIRAQESIRIYPLVGGYADI